MQLRTHATTVSDKPSPPSSSQSSKSKLASLKEKLAAEDAGLGDFVNQGSDDKLTAEEALELKETVTSSHKGKKL
jgi:lipoic acid synthetase